MATLPDTDLNVEFKEEELGNVTYKVDYQKNRIIGKIDGIESLVQSIDKILRIERYSFLIYSWEYGVEFESLIGKDFDFILGDIKRRIEEALQQDDRVKEITNLNIEKNTINSVLISFTVISTLGDIDKEIEVTI